MFGRITGIASIAVIDTDIIKNNLYLLAAIFCKDAFPDCNAHISSIWTNLNTMVQISKLTFNY